MRLIQAGHLSTIGMIILSYLNLRELCHLLIACNTNLFTFQDIATSTLQCIIYQNSYDLLSHYYEQFNNYYAQKAEIDENGRYINDKTNGTKNYIEDDIKKIFLISEIKNLHPHTLLKILQISTDICHSKQLSTKWKFDEAEISEISPPSKVIFNPVYPIYVVVNKLYMGSNNFEFAVYSLPSNVRNDRGQCLYKRSSRTYCGLVGTTLPVWSPNGLHLAVLDYFVGTLPPFLEPNPPIITFYRYFNIKGVFKKIRDVQLTLPTASYLGWDVWFDENTVLAPLWHESNKRYMHGLQGIRFFNQTSSFTKFQIDLTNDPGFLNNPLSKNFIASCGDGKHCFSVKPCSVLSHTHDTLEFYEMNSLKLIARLNIPGVLEGYTLSRKENLLLIMLRGNKHFKKGYHTYESDFTCSYIEFDILEDQSENHYCIFNNGDFINYSFLYVNLSSFEVREVKSKLSLPISVYGNHCDDYFCRFKKNAKNNMLDITKYFIIVNVGERIFYINRKVSCIITNRSGCLKYLHPHLPIFCIRGNNSTFLERQIYKFYLFSTANNDMKKLFPKTIIPSYCKDTVYSRK